MSVPPMSLTATRTGDDVVVTGVRAGDGTGADVLIELGTTDDSTGNFQVTGPTHTEQNVIPGVSRSHTFADVPANRTHCRVSDPNNAANFQVVAIN